MNAVDTNVFVYAFDDTEPVKQAKARDLLDKQTTATQLLWQVAGEFLSCLRKWESAGRVTRADVDAHFQDILAMFPLSLPSARMFPISSDLRSRYSLSHWDSMLLAACIESGVTTIYSEDMASGMNYDSVTVVNPFA